MRKVIYSINLTIDGCCDHTKGIADDELHHFYANLVREAGVLAYGRITYQLMVPYWTDIANNPDGQPSADVAFAQAFDATEKVVFSQSLAELTDKNSRLVRTKPEDEIRRLKQEAGGPILLGGVTLPSYLIQRGLVDELIFVVHPVLAGDGRRLLEGSSLQEQLTLVDSRVFQSGCVVLHYRK
ncbi:dihydrofolate reductase family protein [Hymenobacter sp. ASUV-10]|uniref:Dihydrofolate reductase family protein n=1 Tax=Hymenobacter aranciens TaxID=3063996 RepID=A0ABT9BDU3_9BACT|nr:dihydrofolate reductase family protein [Hymenobacter sp. ASUV-10]MDO7876435.1 dihydrofolate reductase family protein [Hymenobacter sp. ASUV-10]